MFRGLESDGTGQIMGHEFTGTVVEVGDAVKTIAKGDKVVSAFTTSWYDIYAINDRMYRKLI